MQYKYRVTLPVNVSVFLLIAREMIETWTTVKNSYYGAKAMGGNI